ncbi:hypothetical protein Tco_1540457 [Tanacetum coccineum]
MVVLEGFGIEKERQRKGCSKLAVGQGRVRDWCLLFQLLVLLFFVVHSKMTYPVRLQSSTLDNARTLYDAGCTFSYKGRFQYTHVLIVAVILVVVVIAIVGVVIVVVFIGIVVVVVVGGVSSIFKLSFVIIGVLRRIMFYYLLHQTFEVMVWLLRGGEISSLRKENPRESNIGDSHNNGDGDTTVGGAIGA